MNDRERFHAICDFSFWNETITLWHEQGLPQHVNRSNSDTFFGMDGLLNSMGTGVSVDLAPAFEEKVIEDRGDHEVVQ